MLKLVEDLAKNDAHAVLERIHLLAEQSIDFISLLAELISTLHRIALAQVLPDSIDDSLGDAAAITALAKLMSPEDTQLFYQIGLMGRRDLPLVPDPRSGFEMVLLRMLAFRPVTVSQTSENVTKKATTPTPIAVPVKTAQLAETKATTPHVTVTAHSTSALSEEWVEIVAALKLTGMARELAGHCEFKGRTDDTVHLLLDTAQANLRSKIVEERLQQSLQEYYAAPVKLVISTGVPGQETPARKQSRQQSERQQAAQQVIMNDVNIKALQETFNASINPEAIRPID